MQLHALALKAWRASMASSLGWSLREDPDALRSMLEYFCDHTSDNNRKMACDQIIGVWMAGHPLADYVSWIDSNRDHFTAQQIATLDHTAAEDFLEHDPEGTMDWLLSRSSPDRRKSDLEAAIRGWTKSHPDAAGEWLIKHNDPDLQWALHTFIQFYENEDPERTLRWTRKLAEDSRYPEAVNAVFRLWHRFDSIGLEEFLAGDQATPREQSLGRKALADIVKSAASR